MDYCDTNSQSSLWSVPFLMWLQLLTPPSIISFVFVLQLLRNTEVNFVFGEDGTELDSDDVLHTIPHHTVIVVLMPGQTWQPGMSLS